MDDGKRPYFFNRTKYFPLSGMLILPHQQSFFVPSKLWQARNVYHAFTF